MQFSHLGKTYEGQLRFGFYGNNNNLAVRLFSKSEDWGWQNYATLSTNVVPLDSKDIFVAKEYSENEGLVQQFLDMGYFEPAGLAVNTGYAGLSRVLRITEKFRNEAETLA